MQALPKEYRLISEEFAAILHKKPRKGYFESIVESGKPDPLDAIEEASMALAVGRKTSALTILENARQDDAKKSMLSYIDELDKVLDGLVSAIQSLPDPQSEPPVAKSSSVKTMLIGGALVITLVAAIIIYSMV